MNNQERPLAFLRRTRLEKLVLDHRSLQNQIKDEFTRLYPIGAIVRWRHKDTGHLLTGEVLGHELTRLLIPKFFAVCLWNATRQVVHVDMDDMCDNLNDPIDDLELTARSHNALRSAGVLTLLQLCDLTLPKLLAIKNIGRLSAMEIRSALHSRLLTLAFDRDEDAEAEARKILGLPT